jgi:hypothetical protein
MLPPELTRARRRGDRLSITPLSAAELTRARELARELMALASASIGQSREQLQVGFRGVRHSAKERKLRLGLQHLIEARLEFAGAPSAEAERLRRALFLRAAEERRSLADHQAFDAETVVARVGGELGMPPEELERRLYGDLKGAQEVRGAVLPSPEQLIEQYETAQAQAVLLRAVRLEADLHGADADAYRELFRKLKFRQLLFRIERLPNAGYRLHIDGPLSLFGPTTKYGIELALSLPALLGCGQLDLKADVRWGKRRDALRFELQQRAPGRAERAALRSEVAELLEQIAALDSGWQAAPCAELIDLTDRGGGVLVPDIELRPPPQTPRQAGTGEASRVLVEVLGYWSRDAVFQRIEAASQGLAQRLLLVASSRLRVSEELLESSDHASLYVYKGTINPRTLLRKAEDLL